MELDRALRLLGLTYECDRESLNDSFRRLAKKYHPDSNRGSESWAHRMMTELNLAYETVLCFLDDGRKPSGVREGVRPSGFQVQFSRSVNRILDGVYTYYQYGLENVHLRYEGVRRFRFRDTMRYLKDGLADLRKLQEYSPSGNGRVKLQVFTDFTEAFFQNALIEKHYVPTDSTFENQAYRYYWAGSESLDYAIKDALFGDDLIQVRTGSYAQKLEQSREAFMTVIREFHHSSWVAETLIKFALLNVFIRVLELLKRMRY